MGFGAQRIKRSASESFTDKLQNSALIKEKSNLKEENIGPVKKPLENAKITKSTNIASRLPSLNSDTNSQNSNTRFQTLSEVFWIWVTSHKSKSMHEIAP